MERPAPPCPRLDHVSLIGRREEVEGLGFEVTPTGGDARHARVHLERTYLELVPPANDAPGLGARGWFLRPDNLRQAADRLREAGIPAVGPTPYAGVDGSWLDLEVGEPEQTALPLLTRRTDLAEAEWPPPSATHRNGMTRLVAVTLRVANPEPLLHVLSALGLRSPDRTAPRRLPGGEKIEPETDREGPEGIVGLTFARPDGSTLSIRTRPTIAAP